MRKDAQVNELVTYTFGDQEIEAVDMGDGIALSDEQIGEALGYSDDPGKAIRKLVERNAEELDGLSTSVKLTRVEGGRTVTRSIRVWGEKGVMAISFLAATDRAVEFRKWARETLYAVRHGQTLPVGQPRLLTVGQRMREVDTVNRHALAIAKRQGLKDEQAILAAMDVTRRETGYDIKDNFGLTNTLIAPVQTRYLGPGEIGKRLHPERNAQQVNQLLAAKGYQEAELDEKGRIKRWNGLPAGKPHWELVLETKKYAGGNIPTVRWHESVIPILQEMVSAAVEAS